MITSEFFTSLLKSATLTTKTVFYSSYRSVKYQVNPMLSRSIVACLSLLLLPPSLGWASDGAIVEKRAILRAGPDKNSASVSTIAPGTSLEVLATEAQFVQVQLANGKIGWVSEQLVKLPSVVKEAAAAPAEAAPAPAVTDTASSNPGAAAVAPSAPAGNADASGSQANLTALWPTLATLLLGGLLGFAGGYAYRERYYRKRLHGLRV
jgi:hypothetical protein